MKNVTVEYYKLFDKKCLFLVVLVKKSIYHVTKGVKRLFFFFQFLVSFDFLKSILDDATVDIKMVVKFGQKKT